MKATIPTDDEPAHFERIARIVSCVHGAHSDYTCLAAELGDAVPFDVFGVVLLQHDRLAVRVTVCERDADSAWRATFHRHPFTDSFLSYMEGRRQLEVRTYPHGLDGPPALCGDALFGYHQLHSTLIVPLMVGDHVLGTLELGYRASDVLYDDPSIQRLMNAASRVLATAFERVQLGGNAAMQDRQRKALTRVTHALTEKTDLPTILQRLVTGIADALGVAACILLLDETRHRLGSPTHAGWPLPGMADLLALGFPVSEHCIFGQTVRQIRWQASEDLAGDVRFPDTRALAARLGLRSVISRPLVTGTTVYGVFFLGSTEVGGFTPLRADILTLFANQATIAIHNGILLESLLSLISHDMRTPLTTIKAAVTGLLQKDIPWTEQDRQEMLEDVNQETDQLTMLISSLIELSRIEMGTLILEKEWCDVMEIFYCALSALDQTVRRQTISASAKTPLPLIYADHVRLLLVFRYLLGYMAQQSAPDAPIDVIFDVRGGTTSNDCRPGQGEMPTLRLNQRESPWGESVGETGNILHIQIIAHGARSSGCDHAPRTGARLADSWHGPGLGLAIARGIVEAHQGEFHGDLEAEDSFGYCLSMPVYPETRSARRISYETPGKTDPCY